MTQINHEALTQLRNLKVSGTDQPLLNKLIDIYSDESPRLIKEMTIAFSEGNLKVVTDNAHKLKSSSAQLGAIGLSETCKTIESLAGDGGDISALSGLIDTAEQQLVSAIQELESFKV